MVNNYKLSTTVVTPIVKPISIMKERQRTLPLALDQLSQLSQILKIPLYWAKSPTSVRIDVLYDRKDIKGFPQLWRPLEPQRYVFLRFSVDADLYVDDAEIDFGTQDRSESEKEKMKHDLIYTWVIEEIEYWIHHLLTATSIALPASIHAENMTALINDWVYHELNSVFVRYPQDAIEFAIDKNWPPIRDIPISAAWEWFRELPGIETGVTPGPTGRAVAALTHLIFGDSAISNLGGNLIWAALGLEAIYGRGSVGIAEQLREKSELLLGKYDGMKRQLNNAYNFRSRFLHGDLNLPSNICKI